MTTQRVIVGADGTAECLDAIVWAGAEAVLHGMPLELVHVLRPTPVDARTRELVPGAGGAPVLDTRHEAVGELLGELAERVESLVPGVTVLQTVLDHDNVADALLDRVTAAHDTRMLVTGRRGFGRWADGLLGSTSRAVATHARVPVVVHGCGADSSPRLPEPDAPVVVAVGGMDTAAMGFAMVEATRRGVDLVAVHALGEGTEHHLERLHAGMRLIDDVAALWRDGFAEDLVHPRVASGPVVPALLGAACATGAALLVVGRGPGAGRSGLGGIPSALLEHAQLPVAIVP